MNEGGKVLKKLMLRRWESVARNLLSRTLEEKFHIYVRPCINLYISYIL